MLRLTVEGTEEKVRAFLRDFVILPQHKIVATSKPFSNEGSGTEEVTVICNFVHGPLVEINEPISVTFESVVGRHLNFTLIKGSVYRSGSTISVTGDVVSGLIG